MQTSGLFINLLGYPEVFWRGEALNVPTQKALALLCYLATTQQAITREELSELLWSATSKGNLRPELHRLKKLAGSEQWLELSDPIKLNVQTDLYLFEQALKEERFEAALELHKPNQQFLRGFEPKNAPVFSDWLYAERARVKTYLCDALRGRINDLAKLESLAEALAVNKILIGLDALDESAYRTAMRLEYKRGNIQDALRYYETCCRMLKVELDAQPLDETNTLAQDIERGNHLGIRPVNKDAKRIPKQLLRPPALIGREEEWQHMEAAWQAGQSINISGPPGVGKTRLLLDFARSKGSYFLFEGRTGDKVVAFATLGRAMRAAIERYPELMDVEPWVKGELSRIAPGVFAEEPSLSDNADTRLFEAIVSLLRRLRETINAVVVDDLQYLDNRSFEVGMGAQARLLMEGINPKSARLMSSYRTGELPEAFEQGLAMAVQMGITLHLELKPLSQQQVTLFLKSLDLDAPQLSEQLYKLTGGHPQFMVETLKTLYETGLMGAHSLNFKTLPTQIHSMIKRRFDDLPPEALRLVQAIATNNHHIDPDFLAQVLQANPFDVADGLSTLEQAQILENNQFVHDLLYEVVLDMTPKPTKQLLHRRIASTLEKANENPARVAHHWQHAGQLEKAIPYWLETLNAYQSSGLHTSATEMRELVKSQLAGVEVSSFSASLQNALKSLLA
jgi:DNA-binding SARP family transcriptional activator